MTMDSVLIFERVWKEKQYIQFYRQLATEDSMTKLGNRNAYEIRIRDLIAHPPDEVSFIMFDIDQMKHINDTYGHHAGDQVISLAAQCIHEVFGDQGSCYRIGGDEFCVILTSPMDIPRKLQEFDRLIQIRNQTSFPVRVSHGWEKRNYSDGPIVLEDIIELKTASDQELYYNKNTYMKH